MEIQEEITKEESLQQRCTLLESIPGVGKPTAAVLVGLLRELGTSHRSMTRSHPSIGHILVRGATLLSGLCFFVLIFFLRTPPHPSAHDPGYGSNLAAFLIWNLLCIAKSL